MKGLTLLVVLCLAGAGPATRPATRAVTRPATAPARVRDGLVNGAVKFLVPADWELAARGDKGLSVVYKLPEEKGEVSMLINQQEQGIPQRDAAYRAMMTKMVMGWHSEELKKKEVEIVEGPKQERDDRFMLKIHARFRDGDKFYDVMHMYRGLGINFVGVSATALTEDKEEAKKVHEAGALVLMSVSLGAPDPKIVRQVKKE
jgi:hypothetical protein